MLALASTAAFAQSTKVHWYGQAAFRIETPSGGVILIDPWLDMKLIADFFKVDLMLCAIGGHFTMDPERAAQAVQWVNPKQVVPMHFGTYPILAGTPARLRKALEPRGMGDRVVEMKPGETRSF